MSRLRALFEANWATWRMIQWAQGVAIVLGAASAIVATNHWSIMVGAFVAGNGFASIGLIGIIRHYRRIIDEMRDHMGGLQTAFGSFRGRIVMMEVHEGEEDVEPTRNLH